VIELARAAARFILPSVCLACRRRPAEDFFRGGVCAPCWDRLPVLEPGSCERCDEALSGSPEAVRCGRCQLDPPGFERLRAAAPYRESAREILLAFKFQGADYLGPRLAAVMVSRLGRVDAGEVAAVPATPRAVRERGYHPAEVLAAAVARRLRLPFVRRRLAKSRETEVQSRLPLARRSANVRRAFRAIGRPAGHVLLVDDVATSGATARECARILSQSGARRVTVWCFARASRTDFSPEAD
jgi:ComF family protein